MPFPSLEIMIYGFYVNGLLLEIVLAGFLVLLLDVSNLGVLYGKLIVYQGLQIQLSFCLFYFMIMGLYSDEAFEALYFNMCGRLK